MPNDEHEIEVTPEMIETGSAEFLNHDFRDMTSTTVANIYRAMEACRRRAEENADRELSDNIIALANDITSRYGNKTKPG